MILIFVIEDMKFKKRGWYSLRQCSQYLELNPTCDLVDSQQTVPNIRWLPELMWLTSTCYFGALNPIQLKPNARKIFLKRKHRPLLLKLVKISYTIMATVQLSGLIDEVFHNLPTIKECKYCQLCFGCAIQRL